jgi:hypothetical protein
MSGGGATVQVTERVLVPGFRVAKSVTGRCPITMPLHGPLVHEPICQDPLSWVELHQD